MLQNISSNERATISTGNIMIVDDDTDFLWILTTLFNLHGYQVNSASNGNEALTLIMDNDPDLIILDLKMPDMDGWKLPTYPRSIDAPVLILTGSNR
jgi:DNA-binding response OmpR family regulator